MVGLSKEVWLVPVAFSAVGFLLTFYDWLFAGLSLFCFGVSVFGYFRAVKKEKEAKSFVVA